MSTVSAVPSKPQSHTSGPIVSSASSNNKSTPVKSASEGTSVKQKFIGSGPLANPNLAAVTHEVEYIQVPVEVEKIVEVEVPVYLEPVPVTYIVAEETSERRVELP